MYINITIIPAEPVAFPMLILNTDGVSLCTKSKLTMWPFFLAINECSKEDRFLINNVVLAGQHNFLKNL